MYRTRASTWACECMGSRTSEGLQWWKHLRRSRWMPQLPSGSRSCLERSWRWWLDPRRPRGSRWRGRGVWLSWWWMRWGHGRQSHLPSRLPWNPIPCVAQLWYGYHLQSLWPEITTSTEQESGGRRNWRWDWDSTLDSLLDICITGNLNQGKMEKGQNHEYSPVYSSAEHWKTTVHTNDKHLYSISNTFNHDTL